MTVKRKAQLNSEDTTEIEKSDEKDLFAEVIEKTHAQKARIKASQTASKEILQSEIENLEEDYAGKKKHISERVENLSAKKTSKCFEIAKCTEESEGISQTTKKFEICDGTKIEDCKVRKKRNNFKNAIENNFAKPSGEESFGDEVIAKTNDKTQNSCENNFNLKKKTTVKKLNNDNLSKNLYGQEFRNQNTMKAREDSEVENDFEKTVVAKNVAVSELEKGVLVAVRVLVEMMSDATATNALKVDCAKEILTRLYGKTFEKTDEACEIEISQELREYCE